MKPKDSKPLNIRLSTPLWDRIDRYRFKRMFPTRTEAIEFLLEYGLKADPPRVEAPPKKRAAVKRKGA